MELSDYFLELKSFIIKKLSLILENLDPSAFQNVIIGILAIFIPFAIVFLADILNSNKKDEEIRKLVLNDEIFTTKKLLFLSTFSLFFFSFFSGQDVSLLAKVVAIFALALFIYLYWRPFSKILKFSEGVQFEFQIAFLKKLKLSRFLRSLNDSKIRKMNRGWASLWKGVVAFGENALTDVFIEHVDQLIRFGEFKAAVDLSDLYLRNIEKRAPDILTYQILPKIIEWNERFYKIRQADLSRKYWLYEIANFLPEKHLPTFRRLILFFARKWKIKHHFLLNTNFYSQYFLPKITATILKNNRHGFYDLFTSVESYVDKKYLEIQQVELESERKHLKNHLQLFFSKFLSSFFPAIASLDHKDLVWDDFPSKWLICSENASYWPSLLLLNSFLHWSDQRLFGEAFDFDVSSVITHIFPTVHPGTFNSFFIILHSRNLADALGKNPSYYFTRVLTFDLDEANASINKTTQEVEDEINETFKLIKSYFVKWPRFGLEDMSMKEQGLWPNAPEKTRSQIVKRVRRKKLKQMKAEIQSYQVNKDPEKTLRQRQLIDFIETYRDFLGSTL